MFVPTGSTLPTLQTAKDLQGDELLHYDAEIELMNLILLSIPNEIYNSVDACTTAKEMWKRVERLMRGTIQNQVDRETRFTNEFDQFVVEPGEALVFVYNRFAQLMNDLERNKMIFPIVTVNTKFLNSLQPEWLKYVTQVRLAKRLTVDSFDDLFDYNHQIRVNWLVDEAGVILTDEQNDFLFADASRMEEFEELSANICLMARIQPVNNTFDVGPSYDSAFISEVKSSSIKDTQEQMYPTHTKIINNTIGDDQINSNIIFDEPNGNVNSGSVGKDTHVPDLYALEQLAINAYKEAEKQQLFAQKVQQRNTTLTSQLELYKERVRVSENIKGDNNYLNEFIEADGQAKHFNQQAQSQFV
ncbi:hypothetical protein Tco_0843114 [Tanacetum coccineum]|uniref:Uncharacterized protein n=1 Tax=Tanacetum coccineum TaxID=301880 RepID=A0ABQ5B4Q2_9ASTR